jgi:hypothetical protein
VEGPAQGAERDELLELAKDTFEGQSDVFKEDE